MPVKGPDSPARLGEEVTPPDEAAFAQRLTDLLRNKLRRDYPTGTVRRDAHPKHHGCVRADFTVADDLPSACRVGIFKEPRTYAAWVRFSNQDGTPQADTKRDIRGVAIKLVGVAGEKLLDDERQAETQDFVLISHPVFVAANVKEFHRLVEASTTSFLRLLWFFFNPFDLHWRVFRNLTASLQRHANPMGIRYWSTTPYAFGPGAAVKYTLVPQVPVPMPTPPPREPDYLRTAMKQSLAHGDVRFDFLVQRQTDPVRMPIEDPGLEWPEQLSPFQRVATLRIPAQDFDTPERMAMAENLSFTPWHSLPEHRPLGGINRARKLAYSTISIFRHEANAIPRVEPTIAT